MIQEQFLNKLLNTKDSSLLTLNNIDSRYFSEYVKEFNFIKNHLDKYGVIPDVETFKSNFPDFELIDVREVDSYLIEELFQDYKTRSMVSVLNSVREDLLAGDTQKALDKYLKESEKINASGIALKCVDLFRDTTRYEEYVERVSNPNKYYISTGFKELDMILGGIEREEELGVIVARTNIGKSFITAKIALSAAMQGLNVGFYSGEMSERKVGYRMDTLLSHISNGSLIHGNANVEDEYKNYIENLSAYKGSFKVLTPAMINGPASVSTLRAFIEKEKLDILFIDQLSLMEDDRHAKNPVEKAANISKDLKNLQVLKKIPIISVSQQNRTKNDEGADKIDTTQLAQSDRIAQDATLILGITRDKKDDTLLTIHIVKSRDSGGVGSKITYKVDLNRGIFNYIPDEKDGIKGQTSVDYNDYYSTEENKVNE